MFMLEKLPKDSAEAVNEPMGRWGVGLWAHGWVWGGEGLDNEPMGGFREG